MSQEAPRPGGARGRRVAARVPRARSATGGAVLSVLVVALGAALAVAVPTTPEPEAPTATAGTEPVRRTLVGCPPTAGAVAVRVGRADMGQDGAGAVPPTVAPGGPLDVPLGGLVEVPEEGTGPVFVEATGAAAVGLFAGFAEDRGRAGLAVGSCPAPRASWWFAGAGAVASHRSTLLLTNPDEGPAVVDIRLYGADGPVEAPGGRGLTLAGGASLRLPLEEVAPGQPELTVEVRTGQGRVVASLRDVVVGRAGVGHEWVAGVAGPDPAVQLLGIPAVADGRTLLVTNPGDDQALVAVEVVTSAGAFVPVGLEEVSVAPGSVTALDLDEVVGEEVAAVRLSSSTGLVGAVRSRRGADITHATGAAPLGGAGVVLTHDTPGSLQLAAGEDGASVGLSAYDARGTVVAQENRVVRPSTVAAWPVPARAAYVVVEPRTGTVSAALVHGGLGIAAQPVGPLPVTETRPAVLPHR